MPDRLTDAQQAEKLYRAIGLAQAITKARGPCHMEGLRGVAGEIVDLLEALAALSREDEGPREAGIDRERFDEYRDLFCRAADMLIAIRAIVDEPLDEREGAGPTRIGQFARIEALVCDLPRLPASERVPMNDRLTDAQREAMRERRDALFPPPRNPNHVDTIDVARWDAFEHGWNECLASLPRGDEGLRGAAWEFIAAKDAFDAGAGIEARRSRGRLYIAEDKLRQALAASPVASREAVEGLREAQAEIIQRGIEGICNWNGIEYDPADVKVKARGLLDAILAIGVPGYLSSEQMQEVARHALARAREA